MAEAGSSNLSASYPRSSRAPNDSGPSESSSKSIGLGPPPPIFRTDNATRHNRRRIKSDGLRNTRDAASKQIHPAHHRMSLKSEKRPVQILDPADSGLGIFSDEYDLNPGVMEDVQRALKMKARREARLKALSSSPGKDSSKTSDVSPRSSLSTGSSPAPPSFMAAGITFPPSFGGGESEVDFSPSVAASAGHPVPRSLDDGATLDWSGDSVVDEKFDKRWSLSISKRKPKDKSAVAVDKPTAENQGYIYREKLDRIKSRAKPLTTRKASMTADQLQRRYGILYASMTAGPSPVNLSAVVRWQASQDLGITAGMERSEPSTWLKHLKTVKRARLPWNVTALVVEEYMKAQLRAQSMQTIPEDSALSPESTGDSMKKANFAMPPSGLSSAQQIRRSYETPATYIPRKESGVDSVTSRRSETSQRHWLHSPIQSDTDSQRSSIYSVIRPRSQVNSPSSSRPHIRDVGLRRRSDEISSSARNSWSEGYSHSEDLATRKGRRKPRPLAIEGANMTESGPDGEFLPQIPKPVTIDTTSNLESIPTARAESLVAQDTEDVAGTSSKATHENKRSVLLRRVRRSLPSSDRMLYVAEEKRQQQADEEKERQEYESRAQLLEGAIKQNYRIRQILQRVTTEVREFDGVQSSLSGLLGVPCLNVPPEVLDAFAHDPSAVTGSTRRMKSWRAVEDIHGRIGWQRDVLQTYAANVAAIGDKLVLPTGIFDESVDMLMASIGQLENHRTGIIRKAEEVTDLLAHVREMQGVVKSEFRDTLAHTSHVYPEIAKLSNLEEKYRNRYQKFYDLGMDALTFLLDSVTPFWRTYGKTIGIDVQDFLIIPWYRNEFTGAPKRYTIKQLPKRSFRHWLGLLLLPTVTTGILILQTRGAIFSFVWSFHFVYTSNPGLWSLLLPLLVLVVVIQWVAALVELMIILAEVGVVVWWMGWSVGLFT